MNTKIDGKKNVAIIGGGVSGIVTAYLLQQKHQVTLFEQNNYLGGHTNTIEIQDGPDAGLAVDTGFIVLNDRTYPLFEKFLARLGVATRDSEMSFGFQCKQSGLVYAGNTLNGLFAQRRNLVSPSFYRFLLEIGRFSSQARRDLETDAVPRETLGEYLQRGRFSRFMIDNYLLPMAAAIWSTPTLKVADFPAKAFLGFFNNHGLLAFRNRPQWKTVVGGSYSYVKAFQKSFTGDIRLNADIDKISRTEEGVMLLFKDGRREIYDKAIIATHADQALQLLDDPNADEQRLLSPWKYQQNTTVLHSDTGILPAQKAAWAAWNFTRESAEQDREPVFVSYYMNCLQGFRSDKNYCVTLNRAEGYQPGTVIKEISYQHPLYTFSSLDTQRELAKLNGQHNTWFCGSYFGYGFHEDAVRSAAAVGKEFGVSL